MKPEIGGASGKQSPWAEPLSTHNVYYGKCKVFLDRLETRFSVPFGAR